MALTQRLQIRQSQALVMTPQLMQAIKLLQLGNLDLVAYVEAELERNPLLERDDIEERPAAIEVAAGQEGRERSELESRDSDGGDDFSGDGFLGEGFAADGFSGDRIGGEPDGS